VLSVILEQFLSVSVSVIFWSLMATVAETSETKYIIKNVYGYKKKSYSDNKNVLYNCAQYNLLIENQPPV